MTIFPLLNYWPDTYGVVAYATTGRFGDTAVGGYLPIPDVPDVYLLDVAGRNAVGASSTKDMDWVLCTIWSSRATPKPGSLDLPEAAWTLRVDASRSRPESLYGHTSLHVGRFTLDDPGLMERASGVLAAAPRAAACGGGGAS
ncbi:hypothetical protein CTZ27_34775 [Streptomyces griseocarneus]|nr:hypothetical protein CTZ27_34775 [Streptomyces griseocarneus]